MDRVKAARVFITIVEQGSMVKASELLGMSRSMVTRYLSAMEEWAGVRLLHRSTRLLELTDAGEKVLPGCYKLQEVDKAVQFVSAAAADSPSGTLRVSASQFLGEQVLVPFSKLFLDKYPKVSIDIQISNHLVKLVEERIDIAIRITNQLDPNLIAKKFGELSSVVVASNKYLEDRGQPVSLSHLKHHNCLTYSYFGSSLWSFECAGEIKSAMFQLSVVSSNDVQFFPVALLP